MKAPYNISSPASALAIRALSSEGLQVMDNNVNNLLSQREFLVKALEAGKCGRKQGFPGIGEIIGGFDANFILVQIVNEQGQPDNTIAETLYTHLAETKGVVVRFRGNETGCLGALRITVGTSMEMQILTIRLKEWQHSFIEC
jgi:histidinol-phosphate aminotransferase